MSSLDYCPTYKAHEPPFEIDEMTFQSKEPSHFTMVPNGIFLFHVQHLQTTGDFQWVKLSPHAILVYCYLRSLAGRTNIAWPSTQQIADAVGISRGSVVGAKKELQLPCQELNGESLIVIKKYSKRFQREDGTKGSCICHRLTITFIWEANRRAFPVDKSTGPGGSRSIGELDGGSRSIGEPDLSRSGSIGERVINIEKDSTILEKEPRKPVDNPYVENVDNPSAEEALGGDEESLPMKSSEMMGAIYRALHAQGATPGYLEKIFRSHTITELYRALQYCQQRELQGKLRYGWVGYFRRCLEEGWVEK